MADQGHKLTDEVLADLEKRLHDEYEQAAKETQKKLDKYMKKYTTKDAIWKKSVEAGLKTQEEYDKWRLKAIAAGDRWEKMRDRIVADQLHVNQIAREIMDREMPGIFELNANFALYQVEHDAQIDTSLTLYNREAVDRILRDDPEMLLPPGRRVSQQIQEGKAKRWERQKIQSVMTQGILQGESIPKLASRLASAVADSDYKAAVRNARTMATNAQNAGRYDAYNRLTNNGVELTLEWAATLDNRTRHEHRLMHGQRRNVGEPFEVSGVKIMYPAQTGSFMSIENAPQELIWNCRCTILAFVKGYEHDTIKHSDKMGKMTFEQWLEAKPKPQDILHQKNRGDELEQDYIKWYRKISKEADEILANRKPDPFKGPDFTPAKTTEEAEAFAGRFISGGYKSVVNYKGVDLEYANEFNRAFNDVLAHYDPQYKLRSIQPMNMRDKRFNGSTADAAYQWGLNDLFFNKAYFKSKKEFEKHLAQHKELMDQVLPHVDALIDRFKGQTGFAAKKQLEYAEALKASGRSNVSGADPYGTMVHEIGHYLDDMLFRKEMKARGFDLSASYASYAKNISAYAAETANEYVAESFLAYWKGERDNLDPDLIAIFEGTRK